MAMLPSKERCPDTGAEAARKPDEAEPSLADAPVHRLDNPHQLEHTLRFAERLLRLGPVVHRDELAYRPRKNGLGKRARMSQMGNGGSSRGHDQLRKFAACLESRGLIERHGREIIIPDTDRLARWMAAGKAHLESIGWEYRGPFDHDGGGR